MRDTYLQGQILLLFGILNIVFCRFVIYTCIYSTAQVVFQNSPPRAGGEWI